MPDSYLAKAQGEILMAVLTLVDVSLGQELVEMLGGHLFSPSSEHIEGNWEGSNPDYYVQ